LEYRLKGETLDLIKRIKLFEDLFGDDTATDSLQFTLARDLYDKKYSLPDERLKSPKSMIGSVRNGKTLIVKFSGIDLSIKILKYGIINITWKPNAIDTLLSELPEYDDDLSFSLKKDFADVKIDDLTIEVEKDGTINFKKHDKLIRKDLPPSFGRHRIVQYSRIRVDSVLHGLGEKALGMNLRGTKSLIWNHDANGLYGPGDDPLYLSIPFYIDISADIGYFILYDNPSRAEFDLCYSQTEEIKVEFASGGLDYYIGFGDIRDLVEKYSMLSGLPPIPPQWSLGFHQSRYSYMSVEEVSAIHENFVKNRLPLSAIHLDIDYMNGYRIFSFDQERFREIRKLADRLLKDGVKLVTIIDPAVKFDPGFEMYREGLENGYFINAPDGNILYAPVWAGMSAFPDFTKNDTQKWWGGKYKFYFENGISGFWHDMNEPAAFTLWGDNSLPDSARLGLGDHLSTHNLYGLFMAKSGYEGILSLKPEERPFILSRSGWAGIQRYAFVWTGDTASTWAEMHSTISTILNMGLSGIQFAGVDVGGFSGNPSDDLFLRWFQMATFLPFFRVHSSKGTRMREPWLFGKKYLDIFRKFLDLRYSLFPYLYALSYEAHKTGHPLVRPVSWIDPSYDPSADGVFMLGNSMFIAPVLTKNQRDAVIMLPSGRWFNFWDKTQFEGIVKMKLKEDEIPVFVKAGSILPLLQDGRMILHVYISDSCSGSLYIDDGRKDPRSVEFRFSCVKSKDGFRLDITKIDGGFESPEYLVFKFHGIKIKNVENKKAMINKKENTISLLSGETFLKFN